MAPARLAMRKPFPHIRRLGRKSAEVPWNISLATAWVRGEAKGKKENKTNTIVLHVPKGRGEVKPRQI